MQLLPLHLRLKLPSKALLRASLLLGATAFLMEGIGATAATVTLPDRAPSQSTQAVQVIAQTDPNSDDVVVDTEPDGSTPDSSGNPSSNDPRFECRINQGQYTVMYLPESQPSQSYPWAVPGVMGGGWSAERRCYEISRRLESYRPDGLVEMRNGIENGYNTVCVTTERVPSCRIVLTVPVGQDPQITRDRVFENLTIADSGQATQGVTTYRGNQSNVLNQVGDLLGIDLPSIGRRNSTQRANNQRSSNIDLRPFLDPADGGTGSMLKNNAPRKRSTLSPDRFR